jgi:hypothetical protein
VHLVRALDPPRTTPFCGMSERFAGAGSERTPLSRPDP